MKKQTRDSNIELLRIFAMLGVVILHYNNEAIGGGFYYVAEGSVNCLILLALEGLFICAVDLFVLITGYFSCNSRRADPAKVVSLLLQVVVFRVITYGVNVLQGTTFSVSELVQTLLPVNYFVILYGAMYLLSPYINHLLRHLSKDQFKKLLILALLLFSVWPTAVDALMAHKGWSLSGMQTIGLNGSGGGYTIVNFILMYLVGAYLKMAQVDVKKRFTVPVVAVCTVVLTIGGLNSTTEDYAWAYCNPVVIIEAVAIFLLFRKFSIHSRVVNYLAKGSFTCFLLHTFFLPYFRIGEAVQKSPLYLLGHIAVTVVGIYLLCFAAYVIYDFLSKPIKKLIGVLFKRTGWEVSVEEKVCQQP